jgi:purple acid phosphatase-like protein
MSSLTSCPQDLLLLVRCLRFSNRNGFRYFFRAALFLGVLIAGGGNSWAQTWISAVSATTTSNRATVTWATAVPADSQVEYGTTASYGSVTALAANKVATHSVALSGLTGGTTYHFRVRARTIL